MGERFEDVADGVLLADDLDVPRLALLPVAPVVHQELVDLLAHKGVDGRVDGRGDDRPRWVVDRLPGNERLESRARKIRSQASL